MAINKLLNTALLTTAAYISSASGQEILPTQAEINIALNTSSSQDTGACTERRMQTYLDAKDANGNLLHTGAYTSFVQEFGAMNGLLHQYAIDDVRKNIALITVDESGKPPVLETESLKQRAQKAKLSLSVAQGYVTDC